MLRFQAPQLSGTSVEYSPFFDNRLVLGTAANFGIVGPGRVFSLEILPSGQFAIQSSFETKDAVLSVAHSETNASHIAAGCGDGSVLIFDTAQPHRPPVAHREHTREVSSLCWSSLQKQQFCSASWDGSIKLWTADGQLQQTLAPSRVAHPATAESTAVHAASFSPHMPYLIASAQASGDVQLRDTREPLPKATWHTPPGSGECLTLDWNKYRPYVLAVAGSDGAIRVLDIRSLADAPLVELHGHELAIKSVKWSPHSPHHLLSASYDMTARVWTDELRRAVPLGPPPGLLRTFARHTEFVTACDWSLWGEPGWVATTSYDRSLYVWKA